MKVLPWKGWYALLSEQEFKELPEEDKIKHYGNSMWKYNISRERLIPIFAQQLSMFIVKWDKNL